MALRSRVVIFLVLGLVLAAPIHARGCDRKSSPCSSNKCCHLVFNMKFLSFSYCRFRNQNNDVCAQGDYCLKHSDCDAGHTCDGAEFKRWGRCKIADNPCLKFGP